jgi:hypothetical protein
MRHLRALIFHSHDRWSMFIPLAQRIINASVHSSTGVTPASLLFGNCVNLDRGIFLPLVHSSGDDVALSAWADRMIYIQTKLLSEAASTQDEKNTKHLNVEKPNLTNFPAGSLVLSTYPGNRLGLRNAPSKLHTSLKGPLRVIDNDKSQYTLLNLATNKLEHHHITDLREFVYDEHVNPEEVARADKQLRLVDKVLSHKGDPSKKTSMEFYIRWQGYDDNHNSWEVWNKELRKDKVVHEYLIEHGMKNLISPEFRKAYPAAFPRLAIRVPTSIPDASLPSLNDLDPVRSSTITSTPTESTIPIVPDLPDTSMITVKEPTRKSDREPKRKIKFSL